MANVKVAVRVRPLSQSELSEKGRPVVRIKEDCVEVTNLKVPEHAEGDSRERVRRFAFDLCFDSSDPTSPDYASQEMVYQRLGCEVLDALLSGYNACVLAYGQSGSGKTYTMAGGVDGERKNGEPLCPPAARGLTPRICEGLFARLRASSSSSSPAAPCSRSPSPNAPRDKAALRVKVSFLEIYKERVRDLLQPDDGACSPCRGVAPPFILRVREHPRHGPYVQGLSEHVVEDASSLAALVSRGEWARRVGSTAGNPRSSRGHALLAICPLSHHHTSHQHHRSSSAGAPPRLHLVDLAGSERAGSGTPQIGAGVEGDNPREEFAARLKEGASINRSLVTLGNVISALAERCTPPSGRLGDGEEDSTTSVALTSSSSSSSSQSPRAASSIPSSPATTTSCTPFSSPSSSPRRTRRGGNAPGGNGKGGGSFTASFFVPYRDSVLTWLLKDSLGGNSKTVMVAAISPSSTCYNETISTLRYAQRTKCIVNSPVVNDEDPNARIIRELRAEVRKLRGMLLSVQMAESLHCRQPDGVMSVADGVECVRGGVGVEDEAEVWADNQRRDSAVEPFFLQGCQRDADGGVATGAPVGEHCDAASDADGTPTASLTEPPPEGATRCAAMGREDSVASEATTVEDDTALSTPPPLGSVGAFEGPAACFEEVSSQPPATQHTGDSPAGLPHATGRRDSGDSHNRSPLGPRAFGGSCELVYSTNGHRVAESQGRQRNRSMSSGGIWSFRRQSSVDTNGPPSMRPSHHDDASSSSVDSKGSADSSRLKTKGSANKGSPKTPPEGGEGAMAKGGRTNRAFQVRTGVAEARRRAAEQARRRAEIVAAVTRRLYPTKRRLAAGAAQGLGGGGGDGGSGTLAEGRSEDGGEEGGMDGTGGAEGRTEAEGEAAAEGPGGSEGGLNAGVAEAVSRARFRLLSRRALGAARKVPAPPKPVSYASAVTQTEGGEMREAGVGTEAPCEGLPLGPLARGVLTRILIEGPPKPDDILVDKWFSEDSLESSLDSEEEDRGDYESRPCGRLVSVSPGKWDGNATSQERRPSPRPLTDLFWECKNGGWGSWGGDVEEQKTVTAAAAGQTAADAPGGSTADVLPDAHAESGRNPGALQASLETPNNTTASGKEKVREWQMRTLPPDSFEEEIDEERDTEVNETLMGESAAKTDAVEALASKAEPEECGEESCEDKEAAEEEEDDDSWGDSSCDDASVSSADSDFLFMPPPPSTPAPRPPPIPARRQLYTITENSEHSDFSDAASLEALSRRSTPPSSLEHIREDWRSRGGRGCEVKEQTIEESESASPVVQVSEDNIQDEQAGISIVTQPPTVEIQTGEDATTIEEAEKERLPQRKDPEGDREMEKCRGGASCSSKSEDAAAVVLKTSDEDQKEKKIECDRCRARKRIPECDWCRGSGKMSAEECRFLNVSILGKPERAVPVSIGMVEGGPTFWGSEGVIPASTASEDSITFVFVGRPPHRKGSKSEASKCAATLPPVLVELIRRSLGGEGRKRSGSWALEEEEGGEDGAGRRVRGRAGLRRCRRQGPLRRSVSVDTAVRALSRFVRMQGMRSGNGGRSASTECLVPEEMGAILEQGRLHAVGEEGGRGAEGGAEGGREWGRGAGNGGEGRRQEGTAKWGGCPPENGGQVYETEDSCARGEGQDGLENPPSAAKVKTGEGLEKGDGSLEGGCSVEGARLADEAAGKGARDKGGGGSASLPYRSLLLGGEGANHASARDSYGGNSDAPKSPARNPEECPLPCDSAAWVEDPVEQDDFDDDYCPSLPRVALGRTILQDTDSKRMQLQEMRNVVFGFPEVKECRGGGGQERRSRRSGAKTVSWGDEGASGGRRREGAELSGGATPRPIIKRSTSLPIGEASARDAAAVDEATLDAASARSPLDDRSTKRRLAVARTKSPRPDGNYAQCPVHSVNTDGSLRKGLSQQTPGDYSDEDSSGEEFEERACRALSDFLVEATTLLEGLCRASGLSPDGERRKVEENEKGGSEGDGKLESPLDAKEVLSALQTRLSDRHLMRSPPKTTREELEERNSSSFPLYSPTHTNPLSGTNLPSSFESRFSSLYNSIPQRGEAKFGARSSRDCTQTIPPLQVSFSREMETPLCRVGNSGYGGEEEVIKSPETMPSGVEKMRLYPDLQGSEASNTVSELRRTDTSISEAFKTRLSEFPLRNCSSVLLNNSAPMSSGIQRSESEGVVTNKLGTLNRPSSPDLFPDFGRPSGITGKGENGFGASLLGPNWSSGLPWREQDENDNRDMFLQERAWRSSNALYVPPPQYPAPLRESQSEAALCSTKASSSGCCLHGHNHHETRVHHHHHHYHHYPPFVEPEHRQKWENMMKRLSWSEQDEEEDSLNLWRGSAPQLSSRNLPSIGTYDYIRAWQHDNLKADPKGAASEFPRGEDCHTPFSSAPNSPYRSRQHSPPGSLPLSPTRMPRNQPTPLRTNLCNPPQSLSSLSSQLGSHNPSLPRSLSDSLPPHSLARPLNLPPPTHTPPLLRSPTHSTPRSPSHLPSSPCHAPHAAIPPLSSPSFQSPHGPTYGRKFQLSPPSGHIQQSSSQYPPMPPYSPYHHGMASPSHRPQGIAHPQLSGRSSLRPHSPNSMAPPSMDANWQDGTSQTIGSGLSPHAYLRHLVDVRKEVVAATRACNPHLRSSTSHPT